MSQKPDTFAPTIRKKILNALEHIIPSLDSHQFLQFLAEPPFDFTHVQHTVERKELLPDQVRSPLQILQRWEDAGIMAVRMPVFGFVYEGLSYERVGVTRSVANAITAQGTSEPDGITIVPIPAPGIICYPSFGPHSDGTPPSNPWPGSRSVLGAQLLNDSVFVFLCGDTITHCLDIRDTSLVQMGLLYFDELRVSENQRVTKGLLLAFMSRLQRYLQNNQPRVGNTSWLQQREFASSFTSSATVERHRQLCWDAMDYIQTHLHTPLSLSIIAEKVGISSFYLNRIFAQQQGTTVMRYVTQVRVEAAKKILCETPERISDIAKLVGFASDSSFSAIFHKFTGVSPREFRHQHNLK